MLFTGYTHKASLLYEVLPDHAVCPMRKIHGFVVICFVVVTISITMPLKPSDAYVRKWNIPSLLQIMACRLFGTKPFSEPMLHIIKCIPRNIFQWNFIENSKVSIQRNALEMSSAIWRSFCLGLNMLMDPNCLLIRLLYSRFIASGQSYKCPCATEVTLMSMGKNDPCQTTTKLERCIILGMCCMMPPGASFTNMV